MVTLFRWLVRLVSAVLVLGVVALGIVYWFLSRSLPDYDETVEVAGITAPVTIVRDNSNVPHIFGETDEDVFFALGYAHAQDRLWQMTMLRRAGQGRLSELFGEATLPIDDYLRRLDLYTYAREAVSHQTPEAQAALQAYSAGVNAWIARVNEGALGRGAPEMWLFNHPIAYWTPADSLLIVKLMSVRLTGQLEEEVTYARTKLALEDRGMPPERLADLFPTGPQAGAPLAALPPYRAMVPDLPDPFATFADADLHRPRHPLDPVGTRGLTGASNAWAAAPSRTTSGSTLLANDPHLGLTAPSIWYLARLELQTGGVIGGTIPGVPLVLTGRSADLGWGLTTAYADDQDVFIEEVNPADATQYRTPEGWAPFRTREVIIGVKDAAPVTIDLQWTENGPVIPPEHFGLRYVRPRGHVTALAWPTLTAEDRSYSAGLALMKSTSVDDAIEVMADYVAPVQNLTLADRNGIAIKTVGRIPARNPEMLGQGRLPSLGYLPQNRWLGLAPYETNPEFVNPKGGIVGNTNNKMVDRPFPDHVSFTYGDTERIRRWTRLMQEREVHDRDSFMQAQLDTVSVTARTLLPLIGADLWFTGEAAPAGTPERRRQIALDLLANWNGEMNEHLPEPLLYMAWVRELQERLIRDELGPLADEFTRIEPLFIERVFRNVDGAGIWCDVIQSAPVETCTEISRQALDAALIWVEETYGTGVDTVRWGDAHEATHDHEVLGEVPILKWFVNIRQSTSGGDNTLMRGRTAGTGEHPFWNVHAAGFRGVYDFADPDSSVFIISTGQSGHFLSRHYDDLGELWRRGEYIPMSLDPALAQAAAVGITTLNPKP